MHDEQFIKELTDSAIKTAEQLHTSNQYNKDALKTIIDYSLNKLEEHIYEKLNNLTLGWNKCHDNAPEDFYDILDYVLVRFKEKETGKMLLFPRIATYDKKENSWHIIDEDDSNRVDKLEAVEWKLINESPIDILKSAETVKKLCEKYEIQDISEEFKDAIVDNYENEKNVIKMFYQWTKLAEDAKKSKNDDWTISFKSIPGLEHQDDITLKGVKSVLNEDISDVSISFEVKEVKRRGRPKKNG